MIGVPLQLASDLIRTVLHYKLAMLGATSLSCCWWTKSCTAMRPWVFWCILYHLTWRVLSINRTSLEPEPKLPTYPGFYREKRALLSDEEFDALKKVLYQTLAGHWGRLGHLGPRIWQLCCTLCMVSKGRFVAQKRPGGPEYTWMLAKAWSASPWSCHSL